MKEKVLSGRISNLKRLILIFYVADEDEPIGGLMKIAYEKHEGDGKYAEVIVL